MDYESRDCAKPNSEVAGLSDEVQTQIKSSVAEALEQTLERYGVNVKNPHAQQMDLKYLYQQRLTSERIAQHSRTLVITLFFTSLLSMCVWIIKHALKAHS